MAITDPQIVPSTLASDLDIISFTVEHYPGDALGIATAAPRMTWVCSGMLPIDAQILLKVTRRVPSGQPVEERTYCTDTSVLIPWQFAPLASREEVFATMQAVSASHKPLGKPSATLHFEVGLLEEHEHVADFVGPSWSESETDHRHLPLVRTEVELKEQPKRARLYLSALGLVEAEINGVKVGNDALVPGWSNYNQRVECFTYDVTDELQSGANALGFWLGDGWYRGRSASMAVTPTSMAIVLPYSRNLRSNMPTAVCRTYIPTHGTANGRRRSDRSSARICAKANDMTLDWNSRDGRNQDSTTAPGSRSRKSCMTRHVLKILKHRRCARMNRMSRSASNASATRKMVVAYGWLTSDRTVRSASACTCAILKQNKA